MFRRQDHPGRHHSLNHKHPAGACRRCRISARTSPGWCRIGWTWTGVARIMAEGAPPKAASRSRRVGPDPPGHATPGGDAIPDRAPGGGPCEGAADPSSERARAGQGAKGRAPERSTTVVAPPGNRPRPRNRHPSAISSQMAFHDGEQRGKRQSEKPGKITTFSGLLQ